MLGTTIKKRVASGAPENASLDGQKSSQDILLHPNWSELLTTVQNSSDAPWFQRLQAGERVTLETHHQRFSLYVNEQGVQVTGNQITPQGILGFSRNLMFNLRHSQSHGNSLQDRIETIRKSITAQLEAAPRSARQREQYLKAREQHIPNNGPRDDYETMLKEATANSVRSAQEEDQARGASARPTTASGVSHEFPVAGRIAAIHVEKTRIELLDNLYDVIKNILSENKDLTGENSCIVVAYAASIYLTTGKVITELPKTMQAMFQNCRKQQLDIMTYLAITRPSLLNMDASETLQTEMMQDAKVHSRYVASKKNDRQAPAKESEQEIVIAQEPGSPFSSVNNISKHLTPEEITALENHLNQYPNGCTVHVRIKNDAGGHFIYYNPFLRCFITGTSQAGNSGLSVEDFIKTRAGRRVEEFNIIDASLFIN